MKKIFIVILLVLLGTSFSPAHHGNHAVLDRIVEQSLRNYNLSVECRNILDTK